MAASKSVLNVVLAPIAIDELAAIWQWNAEHYSPGQADRYVGFLKGVINRLGDCYQQGKAIEVRPDLRYLLVRRRSKGHGHVIVYRFDDSSVYVLHVFHTAQNWQAQLGSDQPGS